MACEPNFKFTIDDHELNVIEVDGVSTQPLKVDLIPIFAAQCYSFVVRPLSTRLNPDFLLIMILPRSSMPINPSEIIGSEPFLI